MARDLYTGLEGTRPPREKGHWGRFAVLIALLLFGLAAWFYLDPTPEADGSPRRPVVVREGEGWREAAARLHEQGIVRQPLTFQAIVLLSGERSNLRPGRYRLARGTSSRDLIAILTDPSSAATLVVPEGWRLEQMGEALAEHGAATPEQWRAALASPPASPLLRARPDGAGLEGYIYPGSYSLTADDPAAQLVREGVRNLEERLTPEIRTGFARQGLSVHEGLTVASIVEREARVARERPVIASVYLNRLDQGMRLQADPTTQYAVGEPGNWWKGGLTAGDLRDPSPYNTYVHAGLPPGPICSPGIAAIRAVAEPADTAFLYFVARGDGGHAFAETYEEHRENVRRYLGR